MFMSEMECEIMEMMLRGDHPVLAFLRRQLSIVEVKKRDSTGVGFFTTFCVPPTAPRAEWTKRLIIGDVHAEIEGVQHGAGLLLFVGDDGMLRMLEGYTYDNPWPANAKLSRLYYLHRAAGSPNLEETTDRDLAYALGSFA